MKNNPFEKVAKIKFSKLEDFEIRAMLMTHAEPRDQYMEYIIKYARPLSDETMKVLYHKIGDHSYLSAIFSEMAMSPVFIEYLIKNAKGILLSSVIKHQKIPDKTLMDHIDQLELIDSHLKKVIISEKLETPSYLHKFATDGGYFERMLVVGNPNMTETLLKMLTTDPYKPVSTEAKRRLKSKLFK